MKRTHVLAAALALLALLPGGMARAGGGAEPGTPAGRPPTVTEKQSDELAASIDSHLIEANTRFAFGILRRLADEQGKNMFISPLSILLALAMTYNGAGGATSLAMAEALEFAGLAPEQLNRGFRDLMRSVVDADEQVEISIANSIWYRPGYRVGEAFLQTNRSYYRAEVRELDFSTPGALEAINGWIDSATRGKISRMLDRIPADVMMYLINAIYFKGDWRHRFAEADTREEPFALETGATKQVPMMHMRQRLEHARAGNHALLRLPYGRQALAMYILLPDEGQSLDRIVGQIDDRSWAALKSALAAEEVALALPRFEVEYEKNLVDVLSALGMGIAFEPGADFSGIDREVFISEVRHKAVIRVDEEGSEAAAATVVAMTRSAPAPAIPFIVDRPFFFAIADERTGSILFMGKVCEP